MPPAATKSKYGKNLSKSYILTTPHPQGHVISVKCEEPIDKLTVQVWLLYHHPNFKYCTLFVSGTELRTDGQTNVRTDGRSNYEMPPADLSGRGHKNKISPQQSVSSLCMCIFYTVPGYGNLNHWAKLMTTPPPTTLPHTPLSVIYCLGRGTCTTEPCW